MKEKEEDIAYRPWSERGWFLIVTKRAKQSNKTWQEMPVFRGSECLGPSWNRILLSPIHQSLEPFFGISSLLPNLDFYELLFQKDFWMSHYPHLSGYNSPKSNHMNIILLSVSLLYSCNARKKKNTHYWTTAYPERWVFPKWMLHNLLILCGHLYRHMLMSIGHFFSLIQC